MCVYEHALSDEALLCDLCIADCLPPPRIPTNMSVCLFSVFASPILRYCASTASTGASYVDYYVGDRHSTPPEQFIEKIAFMPHSYQVSFLLVVYDYYSKST